jgi:hypothetical protein
MAVKKQERGAFSSRQGADFSVADPDHLFREAWE